MRRGITALLIAPLIAGVLLPAPALAQKGEPVTAREVRLAIKRGRQYLEGAQNQNGSWSMEGGIDSSVGVTSLAVLALINSGSDKNDRAVADGLEFLRTANEPSGHFATYETALMISALAAANDGQRDKPRILSLARKLEKWQNTGRDNSGMWGYGDSGLGGGDNSNSQYAVLGLRDAAEAGIPVKKEVWQRAQDHWLAAQSPDGGFGYGRQGGGSTGSMTVAGISSLNITSRMLRDHGPDCCGNDGDDKVQKALERGYSWMGKYAEPGFNPGLGPGGNWLLYYMYGLERAGRLSGKRLFIDAGNPKNERDWYREGARFLVDNQSAANGAWRGGGGRGGYDNDPRLGTSFALLFLSKGLAPVMMNKLKYPVGGGAFAGVDRSQWDLHHDDARNLVDLVSGLEKWPKLVTSQTVDLEKLDTKNGVVDLLQAPVLYITGRDAPRITDQQVEILRKYVEQGGFVFAANGGGGDACHGADFEAAMYELVERMFQKDASLEELPPEHPVYRAEYRLPQNVQLYGVDYGCRTVFVYAPEQERLSCMWNKWQRQPPRDRDAQLAFRIEVATRTGVNVLAYATGREPPVKLETPDVANEEGRNEIERGFLQIAKLRHTGGWDAAPRALTRLLTTLNRTVGMTASTKQRVLTAADPNVFNYPILYMHGRNDFRLNEAERKQLKTYLERGGMLFADACCGAPTFDDSFRQEIETTLGQKLTRIPVDHEIFTTAIGHDIRSVRRRTANDENPNRPLDAEIERGTPFLEAIEIDGRIAVVYSKYDISCALEQQASVACAGYVPEDAMRIAVNVILYAMLQDADWREVVESP